MAISEKSINREKESTKAEIERLINLFFDKRHPKRETYRKRTDHYFEEYSSEESYTAGIAAKRGCISYFPFAYAFYHQRYMDAKQFVDMNNLEVMRIVQDTLYREAYHMLEKNMMSEAEYKAHYESTYKIYENSRINEDAVVTGENWMLLSDGASWKQKNVSPAIGAFMGVFAKRLFAEITKRQLSNEEIIACMHKLPLYTLEYVERVFPHDDPDMQKLFEYCVASADTVFYAPWLGEAFIGHIGDTRTYLLDRSTRTAQQLTQDHNYERHRRAISHYLQLGNQEKCVEGYTVQAVAVQKGDRLLSMSDGVHDTIYPGYWERGDRAEQRRLMAEYLSDAGRAFSFNRGLIDYLILDAQRRQTLYDRFDDISASIMEIQ